MSWRRWLRAAHHSDGAAGNALIRLVVGSIFISEGIQKFLFPAELGVGRFVKLGIPWPDFLAPFVAVVEIIGGALLLVGLLTRAIAVPLLVVMAVAITSTKIVTLGRNGFWKTAHEARTDMLMICCLVFLLVVGAGRLSIDRLIDDRAKRMGP